MPNSIVPEGLEGYVEDWKMSPGLEHNGIIFMTGFTGTAADGSLSPNPTDQINDAFAKVGKVLERAGLGFEHLLEMTSYHVGLHDHLETFKQIRARYVVEPYPAWTAIEVAGFVTEGVVVELRCIARRP
ncbi:MAG: Rid family hydrolase [Geminicoccales bacterium]